MLLPQDLLDVMAYAGIAKEKVLASAPFIGNLELWLTGSQNEALRGARKVSQAESENILAHLACCFYHVQRKEFQDSLAAFDRIMALKEQSADAHYMRGTFRLCSLGDATGALTDYDRALGIDPYHGNALRGRDATRSALGIPELSEGLVQPSSGPKLSEYYLFELALTKKHENDAQGAMETLNQALLLYPTSVQCYSSRALLKKSSGDLEGAIADITCAIELGRSTAYMFDRRAKLRKDLGDLAEALVDINRAIALEPYNHMQYFTRGCVKGAMGDIDGANDDKEISRLLGLGYLPPGFEMPN